MSASQLIAASGLLILATPFGGLAQPIWRLDAIAALLVLGTIGTGIAYVINYRIISDDGPVLASTVTYLLPVVAVILGGLVLDEAITARLAVGVAVVLAGVVLTRRKPAEKTTDQKPRGTETRSRNLRIDLYWVKVRAPPGLAACVLAPLGAAPPVSDRTA